MKKQTKTKWDFIKTTVVELTSKNLLIIKGGDKDTGGIDTVTGTDGGGSGGILNQNKP
ncbi:hypothetical protein [Flavobacterium sp. GCM10023249]|uniref:hypothetical protein n=1 Tax=unclassified Flavobacterium TaxID=196869 RepID=UPI00361E2630